MTYDEICDKQRTATYVFGYAAGYEIIRLLEIIKCIDAFVVGK